MNARGTLDPPPQWWADLEAALLTLFPGVRWTRARMAEFKPYFVTEWRHGARPKQAARTVCQCQGDHLTLNPSVEAPRMRPPQGAKRGEVFGADELREPAAVETLLRRKAKLAAKVSALQARASEAARQERSSKTAKARERAHRDAAESTERALQLQGQIAVLEAEIAEARKTPPVRSAKPRQSAPRAKAAPCPPGVASCKLGMLGGVCGLPAPLVLAAAQGSPVVRPARYCLLSVWQLVPSHNPMRGFAPNDKYPPKVQERDYQRERAEQLKVMSIAQNMIPALIFNGAPGAIDGLPVATSQGLVLGGNGRTQGLQLHYAQGGHAPRDYLLDNAGQFGFTREQVAAVSDPVVVRVIETPEPESPDYAATLRELVRLLNIPLLQSLGVREESVAEARRLSDEALDVLSVGLGDDQTLADYLSSRQSRAFSDALRRAGILTDRTAGRLLNPDGDSFSDDGKTFVERLLVAALVPDAALLEQAGAGLRGTLARGAPWLLSAAASGPAWDLRPAIEAAVRDWVDLRRRGAPSVDAYLRQMVMGESPAVLKVAHGEAILRVLYALAGKPVLFGRFARRYADLSRRTPAGQMSLLAAEEVTPPEAIEKSAAPLL